MLLHRQTEPPRGGEIQRLGIARDLSHHESEIAAAQPLFQREQRIFRALGGDMDQAVAQGWRQAGLIGPPTPAQRRLVLHPQPATLLPRQSGIERESERQRRAAGLSGGRKNLCMQRRAAQSRTPMRQADRRAPGFWPSKGGKRGNGMDHGNRSYVPFMFSFAAIRNRHCHRPNKKGRLPKEAAPLKRNKGSADQPGRSSSITGPGNSPISGASSCPSPCWRLEFRMP